MQKSKKGTQIKKCKICKNVKRLSKGRVTCSPKCAREYRHLNRKLRK